MHGKACVTAVCCEFKCDLVAAIYLQHRNMFGKSFCVTVSKGVCKYIYIYLFIHLVNKYLKVWVRGTYIATVYSNYSVAIAMDTLWQSRFIRMWWASIASKITLYHRYRSFLHFSHIEEVVWINIIIKFSHLKLGLILWYKLTPQYQHSHHYITWSSRYVIGTIKLQEHLMI